MRDPEGVVLDVPEGWELLPPGDALLTRNVKLGPHWVVAEKRGRKVFSRGIWAPAATIAKAQCLVEVRRASPEHARQLAAGRARRAKEQAEYVVEFTRHVLAFLAFHPRHAAVARVLAERVAVHATPVGSGTVARTERIPVAQRAEAAVIAWMRHQTTAYDRMSIARVKGERREVRRRLAQRSRELLERYRRGADIEADCPLAAALALAPGAITREVDDDDDEPEEDDDEVASEGNNALDEDDEDDEDDEVEVEEDDREDEVVPAPAPRAFVPPKPRAIIPPPRTPLPTNDESDERLARMKAVRERLKRGSPKPR